MQIYKITNLETGLSYIGKDQSDNEQYMGSGLLIWNSYRKRFNNPNLSENRKADHTWVYNENKKKKYYEKVILDTCDDPDLLCEMEKYYIEKYNTIRPNGYNIAEGGNGGCLIKGYTEDEKQEWCNKISERVKQAMQRDDVRKRLLTSVQNKNAVWRKHISEALTGRKGTPLSNENKEKLRQTNLGNKYGIGNKSKTGMKNSPETNRKISEAHKKIKHTSEWNKKVGDALRGRHRSEECKQKLRKPKPKFKWLLPDGSVRIMDAGNAGKHKEWTKMERVS